MWSSILELYTGIEIVTKLSDFHDYSVVYQEFRSQYTKFNAHVFLKMNEMLKNTWTKQQSQTETSDNLSTISILI